MLDGIDQRLGTCTISLSILQQPIPNVKVLGPPKVALDEAEAALPMTRVVADRVPQISIGSTPMTSKILPGLSTAANIVKCLGSAGRLTLDEAEASLPMAVWAADRVPQFSIVAYANDLEAAAGPHTTDVAKTRGSSGGLTLDEAEAALPMTRVVADRVPQISIGACTNDLEDPAISAAAGNIYKCPGSARGLTLDEAEASLPIAVGAVADRVPRVPSLPTPTTWRSPLPVPTQPTWLKLGGPPED